MLRSRRFLQLLLAAIAVATATALLVSCGSSGEPAKKASAGDLTGSLLSPRLAAPPLALNDYRGKRVDLARYRGKAVLVTFLYTHCPDVCPLIAGDLKVAQSRLGDKAKDVKMVAVSTDPRGDTPGNVAKFLQDHGMKGRMDYLIGSAAQLKPVWKRWHIGAKRQGKAGLVAHSSLVYGVSGSGKLVSIYPANFSPSDLVHDVPTLAAL